MTPQVLPQVRTSLSPEELQQPLDALETQAREQSPTEEQRQACRKDYRTHGVAVYVLADHQRTNAEFLVPTRNLSPGGLAFLHRQMLPVGTELRVELPMAEGQTLSVLGRVAHCRHVKGMLHEVGVQFTRVHGLKAAPAP